MGRIKCGWSRVRGHSLSSDSRISKAGRRNRPLQPAGAQLKPPEQAGTVHLCLFSLLRDPEPRPRWPAGWPALVHRGPQSLLQAQPCPHWLAASATRNSHQPAHPACGPSLFLQRKSLFWSPSPAGKLNLKPALGDFRAVARSPGAEWGGPNTERPSLGALTAHLGSTPHWSLFLHPGTQPCPSPGVLF